MKWMWITATVLWTMAATAGPPKVSYRICASGENSVADQLPTDALEHCRFPAPYQSYCSKHVNSFNYPEVNLHKETACSGNSSIYHCQFPYALTGDRCFYSDNRENCERKPGYTYNEKMMMCWQHWPKGDSLKAQSRDEESKEDPIGDFLKKEEKRSDAAN